MLKKLCPKDPEPSQNRTAPKPLNGHANFSPHFNAFFEEVYVNYKFYREPDTGEYRYLVTVTAEKNRIEKTRFYFRAAF